MERTEQALIQHECAQLVLHYAHLNDLGDWQGLAQTFTEDATFARPSAPDEIIRGRDRILESFLARTPSRTVHVVTNIMVTAISASEATSRCTIQLFPATAEMEDGVASHGRVAPLVGGSVDRLCLENGKWLFSERRGYLTIK